jgi:hypothetical protein
VFDQRKTSKAVSEQVCDTVKWMIVSIENFNDLMKIRSQTSSESSETTLNENTSRNEPFLEPMIQAPGQEESLAHTEKNGANGEEDMKEKSTDRDTEGTIDAIIPDWKIMDLQTYEAKATELV